jgi:hypothetical protein
MSISLSSPEELARAKEAARADAVPAVKVWRLVHFGTAGQAVNFANINPAQQAGEFGMTDSDSGGVDGYYFF